MKFIHCADLHLDSKFDYLPQEKASVRKDDLLVSFEKMCRYASENQVLAVIISGDMFDSNKVTKKTLIRVADIISRYCTVDFLYLSGNHDQDNDIDFSIFPSNFKRFSTQFTAFRYGDVVIGGIEFNQTNVKGFYEQINFAKNDFNILALHGQVADYKTKDKADVISVPKLKDRNIDYLALGHYHTYATGEVDLRGVYAYSGCLDGRGFDELGEKGFVLIDTELPQKYSFIPLSSKICYEEQFDLSSYSDWIKARATILTEIPKKYDKSSIIKLVLTGEHSADFYVEKEELNSRLNEIFFYVKIEDKTSLIVNEKDYILDKSVRGEFIRAVWESELTNEQKKQIISCGLNALDGEDLL